MRAKLVRIGNSKGIRIPLELLQLYGLSEGDEIELERRQNGILLQPAAKSEGRVSYATAYREMADEAAESAEWRSWDQLSGDGIED